MRQSACNPFRGELLHAIHTASRCSCPEGSSIHPCWETRVLSWRHGLSHHRPASSCAESISNREKNSAIVSCCGFSFPSIVRNTLAACFVVHNEVAQQAQMVPEPWGMGHTRPWVGVSKYIAVISRSLRQFACIHGFGYQPPHQS